MPLFCKLRALPPLMRGTIIFLFAFTVVIILFALACSVIGLSIPVALRTLFLTSFSTKFGFSETIHKTTVLCFTTLAFAIPFRIRQYNIGGSGQMMVGATAATLVGLGLSGTGSLLPMFILVPMMIIAAIVAGGVFASFAGILKVKFNIDTVISTILLNFIAIQLMGYVCATKPWRDPLQGNPTTLRLPDAALLPRTLDVVFAAAVIVLIFLFINHSRLGYEIQSVGYNPKASKEFGINSNRLTMLTYLVAGGIAGLAGAFEVMMIHKELKVGFHMTSGAEYGIFGILACLLCSGKVLGVPFAAFLVAVLLVGADALQRTLNVPSEIVFLVQALVVIILIGTRSKAEGA